MNVEIAMATCVFRSVEMVAVARAAAMDFLIADMEHGAMSLGEAAALCVAGRLAGYPVHVRVPRSSSDHLTRAADCGAGTIIVPHVDSLAEAQRIAQRLHFAPRGERSLPSPVAMAGFRPVPFEELVQRCDDGFRVFSMIEAAAGLADCEAIAAVDGIDGLVIGAQDLAQSLGHPGDLHHPDVMAAFKRVAAAAATAGKVFGVMGVPADLLGSHALALGAGFVVATNEINLLFEAAEARATELRALAAKFGATR